LTVCSTYHTGVKASSGAAIFGQGMLFDRRFLADWNKIENHVWHQTDLNMKWKNCAHHDWVYTHGGKVLRKGGIRHKSKRWCETDPWTITSVY
jgi:hypothetical protein